MDSKKFVKQLENETITHVTFIMDYLAIGFNIGTLTAILPPSIVDGDKLWKWQKPGYNDKIISLIQTKVTSALLNEREKYLRLKLEKNKELHISWDDPLENVPEVFILRINSETLII